MSWKLCFKSFLFTNLKSGGVHDVPGFRLEVGSAEGDKLKTKIIMNADSYFDFSD